MRTFAIATTALALCGSVVNGLAMPEPMPQAANPKIPPSKSTSLTGQKTGGKLTVKPAPNAPDSQKLQRRGAIIAVAGIAGTAAIAKLTEIAIEIGTDTIKNLGEWNEAREAFTKKTTEEMWNRNPDYAKFPAAVCYNKGYRIKDPSKSDGKVSVKFELGLLHTDYDCMYLGAPNQFFTDSDGGFINLSYTYSDRCTFDQATGDLTCN